ncbi:S-acyl fatty acid synthase thioesterase, medium chain-like [Rhinatrema bivittatum]|uniref:S-acyl fatty acid synthase thioesterase, medium chain-like n=1 Tax=Rhinatrema bivittatum TaxID=194408 RepID=UPI0011289BC8|nr:S-acyl fatty acid synthase thioesterase, medium chain-like [Rhinatrema bivittatum]XP_029444670.1 S-acyl fatty acid synthase thioesterase, medium chain-like [Rhinatrema bivittatum]XP_029444671.1 S-acyl fatty acid synthase thioesterase, medium chain-like [Rhinatrema bivittatum]
MERLVTCFYRRPDALSRLICFPWGGGGSLYYAHWGKYFDSSTEVYSIRLPGRESRSQESFAQDMDQIVNEIINVLLPKLQEKPFAFFGHSFGSLTSFATAAKLKEMYGLEPVHLFVSGASAPHSKARFSLRKKSELSEEEFLKWMTTVGGTPVEILQSKELLEMFVPMLKADLSVAEKFIYEKPSRSVLSCGISCFDGTEDIPHDLEAWKELTSGDFNIHKLPGGHFYLKDSANEKIIVNYITKHLETAGMNYV